jgi:hypothetical protein
MALAAMGSKWTVVPGNLPTLNQPTVMVAAAYPVLDEIFPHDECEIFLIFLYRLIVALFRWQFCSRYPQNFISATNSTVPANTAML